MVGSFMTIINNALLYLVCFPIIIDSDYFYEIHHHQYYYYYLSRFAHPVTYGDYPKSMRALVGNRLPNFTVIQSKMVKGSLDFLGVNYYTARYADDSTSSSSVNLSYTTDSHVNLTSKFKNHNLMIIKIMIKIQHKRLIFLQVLKLWFSN